MACRHPAVPPDQHDSTAGVPGLIFAGKQLEDGRADSGVADSSLSDYNSQMDGVTDSMLHLVLRRTVLPDGPETVVRCCSHVQRHVFASSFAHPSTRSLTGVSLTASSSELKLAAAAEQSRHWQAWQHHLMIIMIRPSSPVCGSPAAISCGASCSKLVAWCICWCRLGQCRRAHELGSANSPSTPSTLQQLAKH